MTAVRQKITRVVVHGRVQGVYFRAFTEQEAIKRGVQGWVRNRRDGAVEALFVGDEQAVEQMIDVCRRGPDSARVDALDQRVGTAEELKLRRAGELFSVLPTT